MSAQLEALIKKLGSSNITQQLVQHAQAQALGSDFCGDKHVKSESISEGEPKEANNLDNFKICNVFSNTIVPCGKTVLIIG